MALHESAGAIIYDYATATDFNLATLNGLLTSQNDNRISWQKSTSQLVICEGDSRYSPYGYCNPRERFLKLNKEVKFGLDLQMKNSTTAMWVLLNGISSSATIELTNRYKFQILPGQYLILNISNNDSIRPQVTVFNKNIISSRSEANYWVYIMWRINEEAQYCNYLIGKYSQEINVGDISYLGQIKEKSHQLNFKYLAQVPGTPLDFTINVENPANDILWIRSLQIWESPLSSKLIQDGLYKTPLDQKRWINQPLVLYLKFDESVGKVITNSAMAYYDKVQQFSYNDYQWVYYKELLANPDYDNEFQRQFLFCQDPYTRRFDLHCDYFDQCFNFDDSMLSPTYTWSKCENLQCVCLADDLSRCLSCKNTSYLYIKNKNTCIESCPKGTYYDTMLQSCEPCVDVCKTCYGPTSNNCTECVQGYLFQAAAHSCKLVICQEPFQIIDEVNAECQACTFPCESCSGTPTNCVSCEKSYEYRNNTCQYCDDFDAGLSFPYEPFSGGKLGGVCYEICGDGKLLGKDQCDDGNQVNGDGCSSECKIEKGYSCKEGNENTPSLCFENSGAIFSITQIFYNRIIMIEADKQIYTNLQKITNQEVKAYFTRDYIEIPVDYTIDQIIDRNALAQTKKVKINIKFKLSVPQEKQIFLRLKFVNSSQFLDDFGNKLNQQFTNAMPLAKQILVNDEEQAKIATTADDIIRLIIFSLTSNVFLGLILGESIGPVFNAINSVQIIYYLPLIDYSFPPNLLLVFSYIGDLNLSSGDSEDPFTQYFVKWKDVIDYPFNADFIMAQTAPCLSNNIYLLIKNQTYKDKKFLQKN
eukprot:403352623